MSNALSRPNQPRGNAPAARDQRRAAAPASKGDDDEQARLARAQAGARALSPQQRAAIIIALLGPENAGPVIEKIDDRHLKAFYDSYESLTQIPREVLLATVAEFVSELKTLSGSLRGGPDQARDLSAKLFDSERSARIFGADIHAKPKADIWLRLAREKPADLAGYLGRQRPQIVSIVLGQLPEDMIGDIVAELPDAISAEVVRRLSKPAKLGEETLKALGDVLEKEYYADDHAADQGGDNPLATVSSILSVLPSKKRDTILEALARTEPTEADRIRQTMLTFETLPTRINRTAVPVIFRQMDQDELLKALKFAKSNAPETLDFFYANISKRMVEQYQEQVEDLGPIKKSEAEAAQAAMMSLIAKLEKAGDIELVRVETGGDGEDEEERI